MHRNVFYMVTGVCRSTSFPAGIMVQSWCRVVRPSRCGFDPSIADVFMVLEGWDMRGRWYAGVGDE